MSVSRRELGRLSLAMILAAGGAPATLPVGARAAEGAKTPDHDMSAMPSHWHGSEQIAFLVYSGFTALDLVGPHYMLSGLMGSTVHIVAKSREPVVSDAKLTFVPSTTFDDCPADLDILCVPGGATGTLAAMQDAATLRFLADRGSRAKYVTSVCTGSLLLAAAGLLTGYKATSHWVARELLREFGAEPVDQRVVVDRNRVTGAGVTAGIDFGLSLVGKLRDQQYAEGMQLLAEYAPVPPYNAGTPTTAPKASIDLMSGMFVDFVQQVHGIAASARSR